MFTVHLQFALGTSRAGSGWGIFFRQSQDWDLRHNLLLGREACLQATAGLQLLKASKQVRSVCPAVQSQLHQLLPGQSCQGPGQACLACMQSAKYWRDARHSLCVCTRTFTSSHRISCYTAVWDHRQLLVHQECVVTSTSWEWVEIDR